MHVYMCVYIYIYIYICVCVYTYICICIHIYIYIIIYIGRNLTTTTRGSKHTAKHFTTENTLYANSTNISKPWSRSFLLFPNKTKLFESKTFTFTVSALSSRSIHKLSIWI